MLSKIKDILAILAIIISVTLFFATGRAHTDVNAKAIEVNKQCIQELKVKNEKMTETLHKLNITLERLNTTIRLKIRVRYSNK